ncbi:MAG: ATPase, T2SS/T4P/T4SS family [Candidatus Firestonebacteria bacterium]
MAETTNKSKHATLGEILKESHKINQMQLDKVLAEQKVSGKKIGHILLDLGYIKEEDLLDALGKQLDVETVNLNETLIDPDVVKMMPEDACRRYQALAIAYENNVLTVAMIDPLNYSAINDIKFITNKEIKALLASSKAVERAIVQYFGLPDGMRDMVKEIDEKLLEDTNQDKMQELVEDAPVIKLVNFIILNAVKDRATDIHLEPFETHCRIRYRKDGVLHEVPSPPLAIYSAIVSRVKIMAKLDIAESRLPQDGSISRKVEGRDIDFRVSTIPNQFGERVVLRILDRGINLLSLEALGMAGDDLRKLEAAIKRPHGMILVSGPTGSGKTTTLYAALNRINHPGHNILTVEDPVEYSLVGIGQTEVKEEIGLTFGRALRSFLRQDPDIVLVGEMRDFETADIAMRASLTGHLVFSTIHTNDAPSSVTRLIDMGIEPFLINSCLHMVVAQRLVRKACERCKKPYLPSDEQLKELGIYKEGEKIEFFRGEGCELCGKSGYSGRIALFEIMTLTDEVRDLIMKRSPDHVIRKLCIQQGMNTLMQSGINLVLKGATTIEEVLRVAVASTE